MGESRATSRTAHMLVVKPARIRKEENRSMEELFEKLSACSKIALALVLAQVDEIPMGIAM
ncbi:MAG: hypothetical protein M3198_14435 [Actinomycetota bacterium]|nr:hypothetical protein [Actinomycetota bacterium]